jgi:hypothetical protein
MTETNSKPAPSRGDAPPTLPAIPPPAPAPTREQRQSLVRAYQLQAMKRPDPLAANLGVLQADLMQFAHDLAPTIQANLSQAAISSEGRKISFQTIEQYLKIMRQIDRFTQIERGGPRPPEK